MSTIPPFLLAEIADDTLLIVLGCAIFLSISICFAIALALDAAHRRKLARARRANFERFLASGSRTYLKLPVPADGQLYLFSQRCSLYEPAKYRVSNHIGGARRIRGIGTLFAGQSRSRSYEELREIDAGELYLTDREIIFIGTLNSRTIPLKDILSLSGDPLAIHVTSRRRQKAMIFTCNGLIFSHIYQSLSHPTPL